MIERSDIGSARLMLAHLGRGTRHYHEREMARKKVKIEISRLKKISTKSMRKYVRDLEKSVIDAIKKEQRILKHQSQEDTIHIDIKDRIKELEGRLARYMTVHEVRAKRLGMLEQALASEQEKKVHQLALIKRSLSKAENILKKLKKSRKHPKKQIEATKKLVDKLCKRVTELEKKI